MGDIRARDADRDRYVEVLEAAYADGQLGVEDRELRVSRALQAETLAELDMITRDLQGRPVPAPSPLAPVAARVPTAPRPTASVGDRTGKGAAALVSVVVGLAFLGAVTSSMQDQDDWAVEGTDSYTEAPWEQLEAAERQPGFSMKARRVREMVTAYQAEFGTLEAYEVRFFPRRVAAQVPVRGPRSRYERWSWDGKWTRNAGAAAVVGPSGRVDLGDVDASRFVDNVATARGALRVERGRFTYAVLARTGEDPVELDIHIGNTFNESGYLSTTPAGEILRRHPYAP